MKERNDDANRWGDMLCSWTGRVSIAKMTILPKAVFRFIAIWSNYQWHFPQHLKKKNLFGNSEHSSSLSNLEKEKQNWRDQASWLQSLLQGHRSQDSVVLAQNTNTDWWGRMEPEMTPGAYGHLIRDTGGTEYTMEKRQSLHKCCSENWAAPCKRTNLEPSLTPLTNSKRITDLKVRPDTVKLLRGKHRQNTLT